MKATTPRNKRGGGFYKDSAKPVERNLPNQQKVTDRPEVKYRDKSPCRADWYRLTRYNGTSVISRCGLSVPDFQLSTSVLKELKGVRLKGFGLRPIPVYVFPGGAA